MAPLMKVSGILSISALLFTTTLQLEARADQILITPSKTTVIAPLPQSIESAPDITGITSKTTTTNITAPGTTVVKPTTKRTVIIKETPKKESTTFLSLKIGPVPDFTNRLKLIGEQIRTGQGKGWLSDSEAASLLNEHKRLDEMIVALKARYSQKDADEIEKGLNLLNMRVADAFQQNIKTAGVGRVQ